MNTVHVDFSDRSPDGRLYRASLTDLPGGSLGQRFIGTDYDEFAVECEVLAIDHVEGCVYLRPVRPSEVPGTYDPHPLPTVVGCRATHTDRSTR